MGQTRGMPGKPGWARLLHLLACTRARRPAGQPSEATTPAGECPDWVQITSGCSTVTSGRDKIRCWENAWWRNCGHSAASMCLSVLRTRTRVGGEPGWWWHLLAHGESGSVDRVSLS